MLAVAHRAVARPRSPRRRARRVVARRCSTASRRSSRPPASRTPPASVSGFITGMYVVCTPLFAAAAAAHPDHRDDLGRRAARDRRARRCSPWTGSRSATARRSPSSPRCSTRCTSSALGAWSTARDALGMSVVQLLVIAVICLVAHRPGRPRAAGQRPRTGLAVIYMALVAGALALLGQTWAQAHLAPTRTAIIMSMEPVFAAFFAVLLGGEDADLADAARRRHGARRDARGRAGAATPGRGRGPHLTV